MERFQRQTILPGIGTSGQQKLQDSKVLVVGAGGLGCAVLPYLASAGVGNLGIVDGDKVELSNLHRQVLYSEKSIGEFKVSEAEKVLTSMNSVLNITTYPVFLTQENVDNLITNYDLVIDATDNTEVRYILDEACRVSGKAMIYGSIFRFQGQVSVFNYQGGPSYRSLFPEEDQSSLNCAEAGVLGTTVGMIGMLQANEALKIILGMGEILSGQLLIYNMLKNDQQIFEFGNVLQPKKPDISISFEMITAKEAIIGKSVLLDVRELGEMPEVNLENGIQIPLSVLEKESDSLDIAAEYLIFCKSGARSRKAADLLSQKGFQKLKLIRGGAKDFMTEGA